MSDPFNGYAINRIKRVLGIKPGDTVTTFRADKSIELPCVICGTPTYERHICVPVCDTHGKRCKRAVKSRVAKTVTDHRKGSGGFEFARLIAGFG